jgi:hypothetical protein
MALVLRHISSDPGFFFASGNVNQRIIIVEGFGAFEGRPTLGRSEHSGSKASGGFSIHRHIVIGSWSVSPAVAFQQSAIFGM